MSAPETPLYGFQERLKAEFPSQIGVDATEICNLACIHCPHPSFKTTEHYAGRSLDEDLHAKMVEEVRVHGKGSTQYIRYTSNGEPLVHPAIYDMLELAVRRSGVVITLTTNGTLLNEKRVERLLATGVHIVDVSLDALTPETYARIRVNGNLEVTRGNVLRLLERSRGGSTKVVVSYVEQPDNVGETKEFESYWKGQGAHYVVIRRMHSFSGAVPGLGDRFREEAAREPRRPCLYPWERIILNPRGQLTFCPLDWVHGSVIGDYRDTTIKEAWQGDFFRRLRAAHLSNNYSNHAFCGQCPDWRSTRWPAQGRSYANMIEDLKGKE